MKVSKSKRAFYQNFNSSTEQIIILAVVLPPCSSMHLDETEPISVDIITLLAVR